MYSRSVTYSQNAIGNGVDDPSGTKVNERDVSWPACRSGSENEREDHKRESDLAACNLQGEPYGNEILQIVHRCYI